MRGPDKKATKRNETNKFENKTKISDTTRKEKNNQNENNKRQANYNLKRSRNLRSKNNDLGVKNHGKSEQKLSKSKHTKKADIASNQKFRNNNNGGQPKEVEKYQKNDDFNTIKVNDKK